jgi:hypothetical protein
MNPKVKAAKRLVNALNDDLDFAMYLMAHPNEDRAMDRLMDDVESVQVKHKIIESSGDRVK